MRIIFTGGNGRFGQVFKKKTNLKDIIFPSRRELNILKIKQIETYLLKKKPTLKKLMRSLIFLIILRL